ncbi:hypothetical protein, partial [Parvibaculum sp.]|uniref:hypothetical protein n=1 Tax=Parvibaculum sp. TaxID=2024848 RepID=UPI0032977B7F
MHAKTRRHEEGFWRFAPKRISVPASTTGVIPAKAGTHWFPQQELFAVLPAVRHCFICESRGKLICEWVPAFAGMTILFW